MGDTPASGLIGGFKEGVGGANRCCRTCMIARTELCTKVGQQTICSGVSKPYQANTCCFVCSGPTMMFLINAHQQAIII